MPLVQIFSFSASKALLSDSSLAKPFLEYLKQTEGCLNVLHGFQAEDNTRLMILIFWKSYQDYDNLAKRDDYSALIAELPTSLPDSLDITTVDFIRDPTRAFDAPFTDISMIKVKDDCPKEEVKLAFASLQGLIEQWKKEKGLSEHDYPTCFVWGKVLGTPDTYCCSASWGSLEVHVEIFKWVGENPANLVSLSSIVEADIKHVAVRRN